MNLRCSECKYTIFYANDEDENSDCPRDDYHCGGYMRYFRPCLPLTGDPAFQEKQIFYNWRDRMQVVYAAAIEDKKCRKKGIVPVRLRRGLWWHLV
jgi:hypothetical protein